MIAFHYGNSLERMVDIPTGHVDIILYDFPWGILSQNNHHPDVQWDEKPSLSGLGEITDRLLSATGYVVVFGDRKLTSEVENKWKHIFSLRDQIFWAKPSNIPISNMKPVPVHEYIHIYMRKGIGMNKCTWNPRVLPGKPYLKKGRAGTVSTRRQVKSAIHENATGMRHIKSVIYAPNKPAMKMWERQGMRHPTMKPVQLLSQIIRAYSNPGDMVLDPFGGSASTALTSFLTGRNCVSYENDSMWYQQSITRFNRVKAMLGPGQVEQLLRQPELRIDEFDTSALFSKKKR
jgi:hypothetical protein